MSIPADNPKIEVKKTKYKGLGVFATKNIKKGEIISTFNGGKVLKAKRCNYLPIKPENIRDHTVQFGEEEYMYNSKTLAQLLNHSCNPNCGIKNLFDLVATKNIKKGEELNWDYEMTEDSDWRLKCKCGSKSCRHIIGAHNLMPKNLKKKYKGYISDWLVKKYNQKNRIISK